MSNQTDTPRTIAALERELARAIASRDAEYEAHRLTKLEVARVESERDDYAGGTAAIKCPYCKGRGGFDCDEDSLPCGWCKGSGSITIQNIQLEAVTILRENHDLRTRAWKAEADRDQLAAEKEHLTKENDHMRNAIGEAEGELESLGRPEGEYMVTGIRALAAEKSALEQRVAELSRDVEELRGEEENSRPTWSELQQSLILQRRATESNAQLVQALERERDELKKLLHFRGTNDENESGLIMSDLTEAARDFKRERDAAIKERDSYQFQVERLREEKHNLGVHYEDIKEQRDDLKTQLKEAREQRDEARALLDGIVSQFASLKGGDATCRQAIPSSSQASEGASEVRPSLRAEPDFFYSTVQGDTPKTVEAWVKCQSLKDHTQALVMRNCAKHFETKLSEALAQIERLRGALNYARPYVKNASVRMYDGTNGVHIREEAKARLAAIDAALAQEPVAP